MSAARFYLTTPIYYASGEPHLGHAYATLLTDTIARYHRQAGESVLFLTGTDEHGQKIQEEAEQRGIEPLALCDEMAGRFASAWSDLGISHDRFIRTTEAEHVAVVSAVLQRLWDTGQIYEGEYAGWYSVTQERYFTEKEVGPERVDPIAGKPVVRIEETNYFFRMSAYQDRLVRHIEENPDWIVPESRRNEILGFLRNPLEDLSISRPKSRLRWGITLPFDPDHVTYVWVDALLNYVTASGAIRPNAEPGDQGFDDTSGSWWPADLHVLGKDIVTTHAVYWPTILMACGLPLPRQILAHGWWVVEDRKMSKSLGNVVDPLELRAEFGTDAVRWYLMREMPTGGDASYTPERFLARYDELANVLGNLASRVTSMVARYRDGIVPAARARGLDDPIARTLTEFREAMDALKVHDALAGAMELARTANGYVEETEPWALHKAGRGTDLDEALASLVRVLAVLAALLVTVMPDKMAELAADLGLDEVPKLDEASTLAVAGRSVRKGAPLFPRIERSDAGSGSPSR